MTENTAAASKKKSFEERAASKPTELHEQFAKWIEMETGYKPDLKTVQLAVSLRMDFQSSPENQASLAARKDEAAKKKADAAVAKKAKLEAQIAKLKAELGEDAPKEAAPVAPTEPEPVAEAPAEAEAPQAAEEPATAPAEPAKPVARRTRKRIAAKPAE